jgi:hypothetical protein
MMNVSEDHDEHQVIADEVLPDHQVNAGEVQAESVMTPT